MASEGARPKVALLSRPQVVYTKPVELWCRTSALLLQQGILSVRNIFNHLIKHCNGGDLKTLLTKSMPFIKTHAQKTDEKSEADFSKQLTYENIQTLTRESVSSEDFDLTLLKFLFQKIIKIGTSQEKIILKFIKDIVKIRNKLFHCAQLLEKAEVSDRLQKLWSELVNTLQDDWLRDYGAYLDNYHVRKYANDTIEHDSQYWEDMLQKQYDNDIEEKTNILNRLTELLIEFYSKNEELFINNSDRSFECQLSKSHFNLSVESIHKLLRGFPQHISEMILDNSAVKAIREQLKQHCQQNDNVVTLIQHLLQGQDNILDNMQEIKTSDSRLLQGQDNILDNMQEIKTSDSHLLQGQDNILDNMQEIKTSESHLLQGQDNILDNMQEIKTSDSRLLQGQDNILDNMQEIKTSDSHLLQGQDNILDNMQEIKTSDSRLLQGQDNILDNMQEIKTSESHLLQGQDNILDNMQEIKTSESRLLQGQDNILDNMQEIKTSESCLLQGQDNILDNMQEIKTSESCLLQGQDNILDNMQEIKTSDLRLLQGQDNILDGVNKKQEEVKAILTTIQNNLKLNEAVYKNGVQYEILTISSVRVFWDKLPDADKYKVTVLCEETGNTTVKTELRESCVLADLTQGDYLVKVAAVQNIVGVSLNGESSSNEIQLKIMEKEVRKKDLVKSTQISWSTEPGPGDWTGLQQNGQKNTNSTCFMGDLQGYIPVRLIPLVGIYLKTDDTLDRTKVCKWLQSGMRFFYIKFDIAVKTELLLILADFVKENSTEGIIVMYNRKFTSEDTIPSPVQMPANVMWKFNYTKLKLHDIRGQVVMLDSKKHEVFDNRKIFDGCNYSETQTPENKYWELDFRQLKSNQVFINLMKTQSIDRVNVANTHISDFLLENSETLNTCHTHEAPMMVTCISSDSDLKAFTDTIGSNASFVTCGAVAFHGSCDCPVSNLILTCRRWQNMVKYLLDSIEKQFNISISQKFKPAIVQDLKRGLLPQIIALNRASIYFCKIIKDEIGTNQVRYRDFLDKLIDLSVINVEHRVLLNAAITDNIKYEDELLAIIHKEIKEMKPELVDAYLDQFLTVLVMNHDTRPLAYLIKDLVEKAITYTHYDEDMDCFSPPPVEQRHRVVVTVGSVNQVENSITQLKTKPEVMRNVNGFSNTVVGVPCEKQSFDYGSIHISFDVAHDWDLQAVKTSVEHGIFLRRYCRWVTEKGFVYAGDEPVYVTFSVDGEVVFVHNQNTPPMKSAMVGDIPTDGPICSSEYQEKENVIKGGRLKRLAMTSSSSDKADTQIRYNRAYIVASRPKKRRKQSHLSQTKLKPVVDDIITNHGWMNVTGPLRKTNYLEIYNQVYAELNLLNKQNINIFKNLQQKFDMSKKNDIALMRLIQGYDAAHAITGKWQRALRCCKNCLSNIHTYNLKHSLIAASQLYCSMSHHYLRKNKPGKFLSAVMNAAKCIQFYSPSTWTARVYALQGHMYDKLAQLNTKYRNSHHAQAMKYFKYATDVWTSHCVQDPEFLIPAVCMLCLVHIMIDTPTLPLMMVFSSSDLVHHRLKDCTVTQDQITAAHTLLKTVKMFSQSADLGNEINEKIIIAETLIKIRMMQIHIQKREYALGKYYLNTGFKLYNLWCKTGTTNANSSFKLYPHLPQGVKKTLDNLQDMIVMRLHSIFLLEQNSTDSSSELSDTSLSGLKSAIREHHHTQQSSQTNILHSQTKPFTNVFASVTKGTKLTTITEESILILTSKSNVTKSFPHGNRIIDEFDVSSYKGNHFSSTAPYTKEEPNLKEQNGQPATTPCIDAKFVHENPLEKEREVTKKDVFSNMIRSQLKQSTSVADNLSSKTDASPATTDNTDIIMTNTYDSFNDETTANSESESEQSHRVGELCYSSSDFYFEKMDFIHSTKSNKKPRDEESNKCCYSDYEVLRRGKKKKRSSFQHRLRPLFMKIVKPIRQSIKDFSLGYLTN